MGNQNSKGAEGSSGWRILKVMAGGPCAAAGLVPYFDVLTHVNGTALGASNGTGNDNPLFGLISGRENQPTVFTVVNWTSKRSRDVTITPNRAWGNGTSGLVGLVIRYDSIQNADCDTFHVLDLFPGSPAEKAGLHAHTDYLLGTADITFKGNDDLDFFLTKYDQVPTTLFVYNAKTCKVRETTITVNSKWGGKGSLGCDVGYGMLHRLPLREITASAAGEVIMEGQPLPLANPSSLQFPPTVTATATATAPAPAPAPAAAALGGSTPAPFQPALPIAAPIGTAAPIDMSGGSGFGSGASPIGDGQPIAISQSIDMSAPPAAAAAAVETTAAPTTPTQSAPVTAPPASASASAPAPAPAPTPALVTVPTPTVATPAVTATPTAPAPAVAATTTFQPGGVSKFSVSPFVASPFVASGAAGTGTGTGTAGTTGIKPFVSTFTPLSFTPTAFAPAPFKPSPFVTTPFVPAPFNPVTSPFVSAASTAGAAGAGGAAAPAAAAAGKTN